MATHSSVLAWRIPGTGQPGGLLSVGSHRVGHDWSDLAAAAAAQLYLTLCDPLGYSPPGSSVHEIFRQEYWSGLSFPPPRDLLNPGIKPRSPALQEDSLPAEARGKPKNTGVGSLSLLQRIFPIQESKRDLLHCRRFWAAAAAKSLQSCPTLCDPIDGSPPGSPIPGILQARTLEWVAISDPMHESEKWKWRNVRGLRN